MLKPKFQPPSSWPLLRGEPLGRKLDEPFRQYKVRRMLVNEAVRAINAQAPGRSHQFKGGQLRKQQGERIDRVGKGKHIFGKSMQRHFDEMNYAKWLQRNRSIA